MLDTRLASLTSTEANILLLNILKQCDKSRHSKNDSEQSPIYYAGVCRTFKKFKCS